MRLLLVFIREPIPGQIKPRLSTEVGDKDAARYYKAMVEVHLKQLHGLQNTRIRFYYAPDDAGDAIKFWLLPEMQAEAGSNPDTFLAPNFPSDKTLTQEVDFYAQGSGTPGEQMNRAFKQGFDEGYTNIVAINSDCPECGARWINMAFVRLQSESREIVIGPDQNGGHYLLALKAHQPEIFDHIRWDTDRPEDTKQNHAAPDFPAMEQFPPLRSTHNLDDWSQLMDSPLSAALKKNLGIPLDQDTH